LEEYPTPRATKTMVVRPPPEVYRLIPDRIWGRKMREVCARLLVGQEPEDIVPAVPTRRDAVKEAVRQLQEDRLLRADGKPSDHVPRWDGPRPVILKFDTDEDRTEAVHFLGPTSLEQFSDALWDALMQAAAEGYGDPEIVPRPDGRLIGVFLSRPPRRFPLACNEHVTVPVREFPTPHS